MGLCKCPKRIVTNLFCFEHRANVCPHCIVEEHQKCIVQSYLQWLNDSNYSPVCQLCKELLENSDCVRLICYDVFHIHCLDKWAKNYPPNTAPAGYRCPVCTSHVFPSANHTTPVADALRQVLESFPWARAGLGGPLVNYQSDTAKNLSSRSVTSSNTEQNNYKTEKAEMHRGAPDGRDVNSTTEIFDQPTAHWTNRKHSDTTLLMDKIPGETEDKYRDRTAFNLIVRWLKLSQRQSLFRRHQAFRGWHRQILLLLIVVGVVSLSMFFYYGRSSNYNDPMLDPKNNPNIHVED